MIARPRTFLLDENMPRKILSSLRREGFNATRVYDVGLRSQPDSAIFTYARAYHMTIITFDTDYLNPAVFPPPHAGIIVLRSRLQRAGSELVPSHPPRGTGLGCAHLQSFRRGDWARRGHVWAGTMERDPGSPGSLWDKLGGRCLRNAETGSRARSSKRTLWSRKQVPRWSRTGLPCPKART
jgi:hypothetical protein